MKRILLVFLVTITALHINAQTIDNITKELAEETIKELRKNNIPVDAKIAVCSFPGEFGTEDKIIAPLGIKIANRYALALKSEIQDKRRLRGIDILLNDNVGKALDAEMKSTFIPPDNTTEEEKFWKQMKNNQRPDYFISGKYAIVGNYEAIRLKSVRLEKNKFNTGFDDKGYSPPVIDDVKMVIEKKDKKKIKQLISPIKDIPEVYTKFIKINNPNDFAGFKVVYGNSGQEVQPTEPLKVGMDYQFRVNVKKPSYIYGFCYQSEDLLGMHMYMLYPISKGEDNFCKPGTYNLPKMGTQEFTFTPSPPVSGQYFVKIIASKTKLAIDFTQTGDGYVYLAQKQCKAFYKQLKNLNRDWYQTSFVVKGVEN